MPRRDVWLSAGLLLTALATLLVEILDSRLLSVLSWYHLSFFAVSLAMLGMAAGAVLVFLGGAAFHGTAAPRTLARAALVFAIVLPIAHLYTIVIPLPSLGGLAVMAIVDLAVSTLALAAPFFLSGVIVTLSLTRVGGRVGLLYGWDLVGAAAGALLVVPLLEWLNISSAVFVAGAVAAAAAFCFARFSGAGHPRAAVVLSVLLVAAAVVNGNGPQGISVRFSKDRWLPDPATIDTARWNSHSYIVIQRPTPGAPFFWGPGALAPDTPEQLAWMVIDGEAATAITAWDGQRSSLDWVQHDVTSLPHHLRHGDAAIIGVGGGRDVLSALWAGNTRVVGIEINRILLDTLEVSHRAFAGVANDPAVHFVHDEARSYLSRTNERFDVLQMSLIDTWAATGAGAFTLSENGLYTREGWRIFLNVLKPGGIFSVSRWFSPSTLSETNRLLALGVAALIDRGAADPRAQLALIARSHVATLMVSSSPFTDADRQTLTRVAADEGFDLLVTPWGAGPDARLDRIAASRSFAELAAATDDPDFDYSPPSDQHPYFFNLLKLASFRKIGELSHEGIAWGNLGATSTLVTLCAIAAVLVAAIIIWPLVAAGRPPMPPGTFGASLAYFALIGLGYMLIQIPFLQRFSILLGHPTYSFSIILFSMILFTGAGSFLSDRLAIDRRAGVWWLPVVIAAWIGLILLLLRPAFASTIQFGLLGRTLTVLAFTAPLSTLLGMCFPIGMRLVGRLSDTATAWMWGVNGACGVMASIVAVAVSMWVGIDVNLMMAAVLYLLLVLPMRALARGA